jgi:hypothetical protein
MNEIKSKETMNKNNYRELAIKYQVDDIPGALINGSRLARILSDIEDSEKKITKYSLEFLKKQELLALSNYAKKEISYSKFLEQAKREQSKRIGMTETKVTTKTKVAQEAKVEKKKLEKVTQVKHMRTNYVLIDFENVQPKNLALLNGHNFKVMVFVGAKQNKVPFDLAQALQSLGDKAEYIKISGTGSDALDFHIAFYIGQLVEKDPNSYFHIISKDTGFDPLIKHLKSKKILVHREKDLAEIPLLKISNATSTEEKLQAIVEYLIDRGQSRPRKVKTLTNTIRSIFRQTLGEDELTSLIELMKKKKLISVDNEKITYTLQAK